MLGYLQSQDRAGERIVIGPDEDSLVSASESEIRGLPLLGWFSIIANELALFYRWNGELRLRVGDAPPIRLQGVEACWTCLDNQATFTLKLGERTLLSRTYPLDQDIQLIDDDLTPFIEAEDFDLFLLVRNVLRDPRRADEFSQG